MIFKHLYLYYFKYDSGCDVAIVKAKNIDDARNILKDYYIHVQDDNITKIKMTDFYKKKIIIISDY